MRAFWIWFLTWAILAFLLTFSVLIYLVLSGRGLHATGVFL